MHVLLCSSKTDPFCAGCVVRVATIPDALCPVRWIRLYLGIYITGTGPLFVLSANNFLDSTGYGVAPTSISAMY